MQPKPKANFRPKNDILDSEKLDDATAKALIADMHRRRGGQPAGSKPTASPPAEAVDSDLMSVMCTRLSALEKQVAMQNKEIKEKSMRNIELQDKLATAATATEKAETEKGILAARLGGINAFLADYGLTYVGNEDAAPSPNAEAKPFDLYAGDFNPKSAVVGTSTDAGDGELTAPAPAAPAPELLPFDIELLQYNADTLTGAIGLTGVANEAGKHGLIKERDMVYVCVYSDGICVNSGLFRPYGWPLCDAFLSDLLEGFYPYEFKDKYPDGFPIEIVDRSTEKCPRTAAAASNIHGASDHGYKPLTREALLSKLPQQFVTATGKLINVQDGVRDFMGAPTAVTPGNLTAATPAAAVVDAESANQSQVTKLQVKFPQGNSVVLHMFFHDTVEALRAELLKAAAAFFQPTASFELCSVFPRRTYDDHAVTLQAAGLVPNCALLVRLEKK
jgi:hypothetical protein